MPSIQPTPSNDYLFQSETPLDPDTLNSVFGSISARLKVQEAQIVDWQAAVDNLNNLGLQVIAENLEPQLQAARDQIDLLRSQADAVEDQIALLISAGIYATGVTLTPIAGFNSGNINLQQAVSLLLAEIDAGDLALTTALNDAIALKADATALSTAIAGTASVVTGATNAVAGGSYFVKSASAVTITLPSAPANGQRVKIWRSGANNVTVARNGKTIAGLAENFIIDADKKWVELTFLDSDWRVEGGAFA